jgi:hypothetical protein
MLIYKVRGSIITKDLGGLCDGLDKENYELFSSPTQYSGFALG